MNGILTRTAMGFALAVAGLISEPRAEANAVSCSPFFARAPEASRTTEAPVVAPVTAQTVAPTTAALGPRDLAYHLDRSDSAANYAAILANAPALAAGQPLLSIVIPAWREAERLPRSIEILRAFMDKYPLAYQVIVRVERSLDDTFQLATAARAGDPRISVEHTVDGRGDPVQGRKGFAVRSGMFDATGKFKLFMDADLSTSLAEILKFLAIMTDPHSLSRPQMLIGSRVSNDAVGEQGRSPLRALLSSGMRRFTQWMGVPEHIVDTQCGFKMFDEASARLLFTVARENGFAFDVELILLATRFGFTIQTEPVQWVDAPGSTLHPWRDTIRMIRAMMGMRGYIDRVDGAIGR